MAISKRLRFEILRRDNHCCRYCGEHASPQVKLTVDHVLPTTLGGSDDPSNLAAACGPCNSGKSATPPDAPLVAEVTDAAIRWAECVSGAQIAALVDLDERRQYIDFMCDHWANSTGQPQYAPVDWMDSIETFCIRGMPLEILTHAADKTLRNTRVAPQQKWNYFMGTAWNMLTEIEASAKRTFDYINERDRADAG